MDTANLPKPGKRKPLTRAQVIELVIRQNMLCGCGCGDPLKPRCIDEHVVPRDTLPAGNKQGQADHIDNRALYNPPCAKLKTTKTDQGLIAKGRRVRGEKGQRARRAKRGGSSIKGRGFESGPKRPWPKRKFRA